MPTCFVIMGFGEKTDPFSGITFNLDKSYRNLIKPAVEAAGCECVRADEIVHSRVIDVPMYEQLLKADLVVADLSTVNANAFFELGVRYALRPKATVCIAESNFKNPFDTNHISFLKYEHLGKDIGVDAAREFTAKLTAKCKAALESEAPDSPVYTFLTNLKEPWGDRAVVTLSAEAEAAKASPDDPDPAKQSFATHIDKALKYREAGNFEDMREKLKAVAMLQGDDVDPFVIQQLALASYKAKDKPAIEALEEGRQVLSQLDPVNSLDPETLGIWAAIHKRLAESDKQSTAAKSADLDRAIDALHKGYVLKKDYYNGINLAYSLDLRASRATGDERLVDRYLARKVRQELKSRLPEQIKQLPPVKGRSKILKEQVYWMIASMVEALEGLQENADVWWRKARKAAYESWMLESTEAQVAKLKKIQESGGDGA